MLKLDHVKRALAKAVECIATESMPSPQVLHAARSRQWVKCLAAEVRALYADPSVRLFFKGNAENQSEFGLDELLYDVCVCQTETCPSARGRKTLRYVTKALWQIESEFARDTFEAVKDFNKLVIGSADNKLFVGPLLGDQTREAYLSAVLPVAGRCVGSVFLAMVPHPEGWKSSKGEPLLWQLIEGNWVAR